MKRKAKTNKKMESTRMTIILFKILIEQLSVDSEIQESFHWIMMTKKTMFNDMGMCSIDRNNIAFLSSRYNLQCKKESSTLSMWFAPRHV